MLEPGDEGAVVAELDMRLKTRLLAQALVASRPLSHRRALLGFEALGPQDRSWKLEAEMGELAELEASEELSEWTRASLGLARLFQKHAQAYSGAVPPCRPNVGQAQLLREGFIRCAST